MRGRTLALAALAARSPLRSSSRASEVLAETVEEGQQAEQQQQQAGGAAPAPSGSHQRKSSGEQRAEEAAVYETLLSKLSTGSGASRHRGSSTRLAGADGGGEEGGAGAANLSRASLSAAVQIELPVCRSARPTRREVKPPAKRQQESSRAGTGGQTRW